jgi:hypothetical protein
VNCSAFITVPIRVVTGSGRLTGMMSLLKLATCVSEGNRRMTSMPRSLVLSGGGRSRVVADTLGHGVESYESAGNRRLLTRAVQWLTEGVS